MRIAAAAAGGPEMNTKSHGEDGNMPSQQTEVETCVCGGGVAPVRDVSDI